MSQQTFDRYDDQKRYEWLRQECDFRVRLHDHDYQTREVVPVGEWLYDAQLRWMEADGSAVISDIGGQTTRKWNPDEGHGALWRLTPQDELVPIIKPGMGGLYAPLRPLLAPSSFGDLGGYVVTIAQTMAGRKGAHNPHGCFVFAPRAEEPRKLFELPNHGDINGGVPAACMPGLFGPEGSAHAGRFFCQSMINCTIYRAEASGHVEPFMTVAPPAFSRPMMPYVMWIAPNFGPWAEFVGRIIFSVRPWSWMEKAQEDLSLHFWALDPEKPTAEPVEGIRERPGVIAPPSFGKFAGHMFTVNEGSIDLLNTSIRDLNPAPLAYDAQILRIAPDGSTHLFADQIQGGCTLLDFSDDRMVISCARKSYSTGEYHEPDGSVFEIRPRQAE